MADFYDILGVSRGASEKEVRQAYRRLARQYHPDVNPNDASAEEKFKEINEAYSVLSNEESRSKYDRYGDNWKHADQFDQTGGPTGSYRWSSRGGDEVFSFFQGRGFEDRGGRGLEDLFGGSGFGDSFGSPGRGFRPPPAEYGVEVTLEEAFHGASRLLQTREGRRLEVKIPPGVDNGSRVHIASGGAQGSGLYLIVSVTEHASFRRQGRDLYVDVDLPLDDAVLGAEISVPTLSGRLALTVPPNTSNERRFRLSGQGMPALGAGPDGAADRGDLYATVKVKLPTGLDPEDVEFFRKLRENRLSREQPRPESEE